MSHSKRNTSLAFFTAHERNEVKASWGSKSTRLTRESFLPFGSCNLCLLQARDPVSCPSHGHLFCRECAIQNLLTQSKEIKRLKKELEQVKARELEDRLAEDAEIQIRDLEDFERLQAGLKPKQLLNRDGRDDLSSKPTKTTIGSKRKHEDDPPDINGKRRAVPGEKLSSDLVSASRLKEKRHPTCPVSAEDSSHDLSLKSLVNVNFRLQKGKTDQENTRVCPSCDKTLTNTTKAVVAKPCGHVLCKSCSDKFQTALTDPHSDTQLKVVCYVCQEDITAQDGTKVKEGRGRGLTELKSDGTGFAGGGANMVKKSGVAFQYG